MALIPNVRILEVPNGDGMNCKGIDGNCKEIDLS